MTNPLRIVLAQLNLHVGNIPLNTTKHLEAAKKSRDELKADLIVFPELSITGYPPEDLLLRESFIQDSNDALGELIKNIKNIYCLVGHPIKKNKKLFNACTIFYNGEVISQYAKQHLPNYSVFDEARYFSKGDEPCVVTIKNIQIGIVICEDLWFQAPTMKAKEKGAAIIISPNASPYEIKKHEHRLEVFSKHCRKANLPLLYANCVGGQDELVFDGGSMALDHQGNVVQFAGFFKEHLLTVDLETNGHLVIKNAEVVPPSAHERIYQALVLAVKDYVHKNNFNSVLIGVSGGIDSALTLAIAVDAIGKENVKAILMPSRFTSDASTVDAKKMANTLKVTYEEISIEPAYTAFLHSLEKSFAGKKEDVTEENIQARCRGIILMALSNKFNSLVLTTGNRSELAVGYCTLYGDMAGAFAVLKDIPKTLVYQLAHYRNTLSPVIPERTIERAPSAELRENQKDQDSLPPYDTLDAILYAYLNEGKSAANIISQGFEKDVVERVVRLVRLNQYKRQQSPVGPRVNYKAFGKDWRYPITNGYGN